MQEKRGFLKIYLYIALLFGIISLVDNFLVIFEVNNNVYVMLLMFITHAFFFFNIVTIPLFHYFRVKKIAYILPLYHLLTYILFFSVGFLLTIVGIILSGTWIILVGISILSSIFEIAVAIYLLRKFEFV
jgi:hypothetical protein